MRKTDKEWDLISIKREYISWLIGFVGGSTPINSYTHLLGQLHKKSFKAFIPNDDNRVEDGKALRSSFLEELGIPHSRLLISDKCSTLELMIALSIRIEGELSSIPNVDKTDIWFWEMIRNLDLDQFDDSMYFTQPSSEPLVNYILDDLVERTYNKDGRGGLFPLHNPKEDQRSVELWYQMMSYLDENHGF